MQCGVYAREVDHLHDFNRIVECSQLQRWRRGKLRFHIIAYKNNKVVLKYYMLIRLFAVCRCARAHVERATQN